MSYNENNDNILNDEIIETKRTNNDMNPETLTIILIIIIKM